MLLEKMAEMALIVETGGAGYLRYWVFAFRQLAHGPVETKTSEVLAHGGSIVLLEGAGEVRRMYSDCMCDFVEVKRIVEAYVQQVSCLS